MADLFQGKGKCVKSIFFPGTTHLIQQKQFQLPNMKIRRLIINLVAQFRVAHVLCVCLCACTHPSFPLPPVPSAHAPTLSDIRGWITVSFFVHWVEEAKTLQLSRLRNFHNYEHRLPKSKYSFKRGSMVPTVLQIKPQSLPIANKSPILPSLCLPPKPHWMSFPGPYRIGSFAFTMPCFSATFLNSSNKHPLTCQASAEMPHTPKGLFESP